ncbi:MAG: Rrf2 family transcriptional regulator [Oscillospiraceae bacterium]|nr:Rrf2 family transcriptional regulator [Oscillospiraceae bacterium]
MLLTKECDYGVRTVRALADGGKKTVAGICKKELIPTPYAYKIMKKLEHAGILQSIRGRDGGYQLAKPLNTITLLDIVTAIDENLFINECLSNKKHCPINDPDDPCTVHIELDRMQSILVAELQSKSMHEILRHDLH